MKAVYIVAIVFGAALAILVAAYAIRRHYQNVVDRLRDSLRDYGYVRSVALETIFSQAQRVAARVRRHVIVASRDSDARAAEEAWSIKNSYSSSFGMTAVAGAIVAQIAITALSLDYLEATHWTASAAFVISLVSGLLSVYFACILQQRLSSLHSPEEVRQWLTTSHIKKPSSLGQLADPETLRRQAQDLEFIPSFAAALLLVIPSILLNWSSISLLIGIGIYYGIVYTEKLGSLRGDGSNLAVLLVFVLFTLGAAFSYWWPLLLKHSESVADDERQRMRHLARQQEHDDGRQLMQHLPIQQEDDASN